MVQPTASALPQSTTRYPVKANSVDRTTFLHSEFNTTATLTDFVIVANAWSAATVNPTSKHQIAIELAGRGANVLWLEGAGMRRPSVGSKADRGRMVRKMLRALRGARRENAECGVMNGELENGNPEAAPSPIHPPSPGRYGATRPSSIINHQSPPGAIWVVSPLLIPLPHVAWIRRFNGWLCARAAQRWCRRLGFESPVLINYVPVLADAMRFWPGKKVYHCVDRWDAFAMYDSDLMREADAACCRYADVVIASAGDLYERCKGRNANSHLVLHGVNHAHFATALEAGERPENLPDGRVVGFFGLLSEWVDQDLLVAVARGLPGARLVLIGKADVSVEKLEKEPNIAILGPKPFDVLPRYVAHFDVGLIPFVVNDLTRAVNPIKLREMLAAGCPVVSTDLPEVARYTEVRRQKSDVSGQGPEGGHERDGARARRDAGNAPSLVPPVSIATTREEFVTMVEERVESPANADDRHRISESVAGETWARKVDEILGIIGMEIARQDDPPSSGDYGVTR